MESSPRYKEWVGEKEWNPFELLIMNACEDAEKDIFSLIESLHAIIDHYTLIKKWEDERLKLRKSND